MRNSTDTEPLRPYTALTDDDIEEIYADTESDFDIDDIEGALSPTPSLRQYLTNASACGTMSVLDSSESPDKFNLPLIDIGDNKMATGEMTPAQQAAAERAAEKKAAILAKADEKTRAKEAEAKRKEEAKLKADKAKAAQAEKDAKEKAAKQAAADKAKAAKLAQAEKDAKAKAAAKEKADKERAAKKEAEAKAKAKAKEDREKAAAKRRAEREKAGLTGKTVPADLSRYSVNKEVKTAGGNASVDCNDSVAQKFRGMSLDEVLKESAKILKEPEADLRKRYAHLNPGMIRMNCGNRVRAALAKGH